MSFRTQPHRPALLALFGMTMLTGACGSDAVTRPDPPQPAARVMFWTDDVRLVPVAISIDGSPFGAVPGAIGTATSCGQAGGLTLTLTPGTHAYAAVASNGAVGTGSVTAVQGDCSGVKLYLVTPPSAPSRIVVWSSNAAALPVTVKVNGQAMGTVGTAFASRPTCGQAGSLTLSLDAGNYVVTAANARGDSWSWNGTLTPNTCLALQLQ